MKQFNAFYKRIKLYFIDYGGWSGLLSSPFFLISALITLLNYSRWVKPLWIDTTFSLIPNLLGFSLGTYGLLFSLMGARLKNALRSVEVIRGTSYLRMINATFFHFIFVQVVALMWAFIYQGSSLYDIIKFLDKRYVEPILIFNILRLFGSFMGNFFLIYSVLLVIGSALAVYRLAQIRDPAEDGR